jgi:hypothetical protein
VVAANGIDTLAKILTTGKRKSASDLTVAQQELARIN